MSLKSSTICINQSHHVPGSKNKFRYTLPRPIKTNPQDQLSIQELTLYHSFFNITTAKNNNTFSIIWNADTQQQYDFVIKDRFLTTNQLNEYITFLCSIEKLYMLDSTGAQINFINLEIVGSLYKDRLTIYTLPSQSEANSKGYTIPAGATWNFPLISSTPQIKFGDNFGRLIGFIGNIYPEIPQTSSYSAYSNIVPQIVDTTNILVACSLIQNDLSIPNNIMTSVKIDVDITSQISYLNANASYSSLESMTVSYIDIEFLNQMFEPLQMLDFNINLILNIKQYTKY